MTAEASVDLYWIPLGPGAHVVRASGKIYEALVALKAHRPERSGIDCDRVLPPSGGRAPGWDAGIRIARRSTKRGV
jgi:hypothetical protein